MPNDAIERALTRAAAALESYDEIARTEEFEEAEIYLAKGRRFSVLSDVEVCERWRANYKARSEQPLDSILMAIDSDLQTEARLRALDLPYNEDDLKAFMAGLRKAAEG